ncbi:S8 family serine peptidase [Stenotrophomonas maltophilia]|uniref:Serine protease n=2 Tax=Pseudomonadota TaxID=1224 RepID=A0AB34TG40_STEMA|nr:MULTISPECIES: autotransporter serine protease [Stenotrophomonas]KOO82087.1 serine protease [Stenotrophomonas maltophilia]MBH1540260.1 S8 family serine peptidase [Stenotrophomonas maltophilia]MBN4984312.1 S8 family serine peptidase [Stenotrophomonas maltophilia]MDZ7474968.1 S8 family serine peptidase [Stenotrophomonas pavanii]
MERTMRVKSALATAMAMALTACGGGGGGGNVRIDPPPTTPTPPTTPPPTTPPPAKPQEPAFDAHLSVTNARAAQAAGLTGQGVRIGIVDSGVQRNAAALNGRVVANLNYIDPARNNLQVDDVVGHGTAVASLAAGASVGSWPGGIAPGAQIVSARIIADKPPVDDGSGKGNSFSGPLGVAQVHQDLISYNVKVMNNSWGGLYWTDLPTTAQVAAEYRPFVINHGGLVVFAAGNDARAEPSSLAALPSQQGVAGSLPAADLERGWLVATAVDPYTPGTLASYANACGQAARYCLAAPGSAVYPDANGSTYYWNYGTSFAAPLVSGAAALVWQRYPYFDNNLVRQTLLGTAQDIGAPGVDAVFGYGLLDISRAIKGPGRFDWGDVVVNVDAPSSGSLWSNDIVGSGGLVKQGGGTLVLGGNNSYAGATRIERGILSLQNGSVIRSNVTILAQPDPDSTGLQFNGGTPRVIGNVVNGSSVFLTTGNTTGTIEGNYTQQAGAQLMIALGANALQVTGNATLNGGVRVHGFVSGYVPQNGSRQDLIHAAGGLSGTFSSPATSSGLQGLSLLQSSYGYDSNTAWLNLTQVSVTAAAAGLTASAQSAAQRVESAFGALDGSPALQGSAFGTAAGALQWTGGGSEGLAASLQSLSGQAHARAESATFDSIDMSRRAIAERFDRVQAAPRLRGAWQSALGEAGQGSFAGNAADSRGWMAGQDLPLGSAGLMGVAFGETRSNGGNSFGGDRGRDRQAQAQLYAGWNLGRGYALAQVGSGQFTRALDRQLLLGAGAYGVSARYGGRFSGASVEGGYRFGRAGASLTPYLGASTTRVDTDAFNERGGFGFGLRGEANRVQRSQMLAGIRGERGWGRWTLRGHAEWQQRLDGADADWQASFVGVDAWAPLAGWNTPRGSALFGVALESWWGRTGRLSLGFDQRVGGEGARQAALRYSTGF